MIEARILIKGSVQMVGFRYYAIRYARHLEISGYVRNLPSGGVEVIAKGPKGLMKEFIDVLRKGPPSAVVKEVIIDYNPGELEKFTDFSVRY